MVGGVEIIPIRNFSSPSQTHLQGRCESKPPSCTADRRPTRDGDADGVVLCSRVLGRCQLMQKLPFWSNLCLNKRLIPARRPTMELSAPTCDGSF